MSSPHTRPYGVLFIVLTMLAVGGLASRSAAQAPPLPGPGETVHWTVAMSPISVGGVTIVAGGTVIVDPGVIVDVTGTITLQGDLIAIGTPVASVTLQGAQIDIFGNLTLEHATVDVRCYPYGFGSTITGRNVSFLPGGWVFSGGVGSYPTFLDFDQCSFDGPWFRISSCFLRLTNSSFVNSFCEINNSIAVLDNVTFDSAPWTGLDLLLTLQPVWLNNITITNSSLAGLNLIGVNARLGPNVVISGNQYPAQIGGSGFLPGAALPITGNTNNLVKVEFASAGLVGGNVWSDIGIPYAMTGGQYHGGVLDILPGVTVLLEPDFTFWDDDRSVQARGLPGAPVRFGQLVPGQTWQGLQYFRRFENCIIEGGQVGARFASATFPGFIDNCILRNNDFGMQNNALVRKTRFLGNTVGAWGTDYPLSLQSQSNPNSFVGNGVAVQEVGGRIVNARHTWWNDASGPGSPDNPGGSGETVEGCCIQTVPFLTTEPDFSDNPPIVHLNRMSSLAEPDSKVILTWTSQDDDAVAAHRIEFDVPFGGTTPTILADGLPGTQQAYEWTVPDIGMLGGTPRIRVVAIDSAGQEGWDASDPQIPSNEIGGTLSILTDLSGPFVSGAPAAEALCWDPSGLTGPTGIFHASIVLDADRTYVPLGSSFTNCLPGSSMGIPFVSTDAARVALRTQGTGNRVKWFFSEPFEIRPDSRLGDAPPAVTMITPAGGEVFPGESTVPITWTASDDEAVQAFHIQATYDAGHTWHFLAEDLPGTTTGFDWTLPPSTGIADVRVRVIAVDQRFQNSSDGADRSFEIAPGVGPTVDIDLIPRTTTVRPGERLSYDATIHNTTGSSQTVTVSIDIFRPDGSPYPGNPIAGPKTVTLSPSQVITRTARLRIPAHVPPSGPYRIRGNAAAVGGSPRSESAFTFMIVE